VPCDERDEHDEHCSHITPALPTTATRACTFRRDLQGIRVCQRIFPRAQLPTATDNGSTTREGTVG
jgi:hypothetical protein